MNIIQSVRQAEIVEVGPRDGFQNIKQWIPTQDKIAIIENLIAAGIRKMEITSFVHADAIPQMRDASEVAQYICGKYAKSDFTPIALVPNLTGAQRAYRCGIREIAYVISASEQHNLANIKRTRVQSLAELARIRDAFPDIRIRLDAATSFYCPFTGKVAEEQVYTLIDEALKLSISAVILADTIGAADPQHVYSLAKQVTASFPEILVGLHLHDTKGMGLAGAFAGLLAGISIFETSVGGLGGCPFAPGAAGNTATEDLVNMLHTMGVATGIELNSYLSVVRSLKEKYNLPVTSRMSNAMSSDCSF